jgi:hypothetical protein
MVRLLSPNLGVLLTDLVLHVEGRMCSHDLALVEHPQAEQLRFQGLAGQDTLRRKG